MKNNLRAIANSKVLLTGLACLTMVACSDDDDEAVVPVVTTSNFNLNLTGLEDLGDDFKYEGWIIVGGSPVSTGVFTVNSNNELSQTGFTVDQTQLDNATTFVLSIEPAIDNDPAPAPTKILAGDFSGNSATVGTGTVSAAGFAGVAGDYILATPTDMDTTNEFSGIWFLNNSSGSAVAGLTLPALEAGWRYEGWAVVNGMPISTGIFTSATGQDATATFSGMGGPGFPGEDFLFSAPTGWMFPLDLRGGNAVISIEPYPDNSPNPFTLKPLAGMISSSLAAHTVGSMNDNVSASFPSGSVSR